MMNLGMALWGRAGGALKADAEEAENFSPTLELLVQTGVQDLSPGHENRFVVDGDKFASSPDQLNRPSNSKSVSASFALKDTSRLEMGLLAVSNSPPGIDGSVLGERACFDHALPMETSTEDTSRITDKDRSYVPYFGRLWPCEHAQMLRSRPRCLNRLILGRIENNVSALVLLLLFLAYSLFHLIFRSSGLNSHAMNWQLTATLVSVHLNYFIGMRLAQRIPYRDDAKSHRLILDLGAARKLPSGKANVISQEEHIHQEQLAPRSQFLADCTSKTESGSMRSLRWIEGLKDTQVNDEHERNTCMIRKASAWSSQGISAAYVGNQPPDITSMDVISSFKFRCKKRVGNLGFQHMIKVWISSTLTTVILASTSVVFHANRGVLVPGQLLWINFITNYAAGTALVAVYHFENTEGGSDKVHLDQNDGLHSEGPRPEPSDDVIISNATGQSKVCVTGELEKRFSLLPVNAILEIFQSFICQIGPLLVCRFARRSIFGSIVFPTPGHASGTTYNMFVWMQTLGLFSSHPLHLKYDRLQVTTRNTLYFVAIIMACAAQATIHLMFFGAASFKMGQADVVQSAISMGTAIFVSFGVPVCIYTSRRVWRYTQNCIANHQRSGIRRSIAAATAAIISASIARSIAGSPAASHRFQRGISLRCIPRLGLFAWFAVPLFYQHMGLTTYTMFVNGVQAEALADTGASLNLISKSYLKRNSGAWTIVPHPCQFRLGDGRECRSSGYIQASIRFGNSDELHQITLFIIDGLLFDVVLSNYFLNTTATVQFSPGGNTRESIYPIGSSQPANAILLTHLVGVSRISIMHRMKMCLGLGRKPPQASTDDASVVLQSINLREREREERRLYDITKGPASISIPVPPGLGFALPQSPLPVHLAN